MLLEMGKADLELSVIHPGLHQTRHPAAALAACFGAPHVAALGAASAEAVTDLLVPGGVHWGLSTESAVHSLLLQ